VSFFLRPSGQQLLNQLEGHPGSRGSAVGGDAIKISCRIENRRTGRIISIVPAIEAEEQRHGPISAGLCQPEDGAVAGGPVELSGAINIAGSVQHDSRGVRPIAADEAVQNAEIPIVSVGCEFEHNTTLENSNPPSDVLLNRCNTVSVHFPSEPRSELEYGAASTLLQVARAAAGGRSAVQAAVGAKGQRGGRSGSVDAAFEPVEH
jgi:hypothetical protein